VRYLSMAAREFALIYARWMMVVTQNSIVMLDVRELAPAENEAISNPQDDQESALDASESDSMWTEIMEDEMLDMSFA
jgi:hypothetical protein